MVADPSVLNLPVWLRNDKELIIHPFLHPFMGYSSLPFSGPKEREFLEGENDLVFPLLPSLSFPHVNISIPWVGSRYGPFPAAKSARAKGLPESWVFLHLGVKSKVLCHERFCMGSVLLSIYISFYIVAMCVNLFVCLFTFPPINLEERWSSGTAPASITWSEICFGKCVS